MGSSACGHGEAENAAPSGAVLPPQRAGDIRDAVPGAEFAHVRGDLGVAVAGQVGERVVLDLVAEVAAEDMEQRAALDVGGALDLAQIPLAAGLALDAFLGEG